MAGIVASVFSAFGVVALINAFFRRVPWSKLSSKSRKAKRDKKLRRSVRQSFHAGDADHSIISSEDAPEIPRFPDGFTRSSGIQTPLPVYGDRSGTQTPAPPYEGSVREGLSRTASISSAYRALTSPTPYDGMTSGRNSDEKDFKGLDIIDEAPLAEARARSSGIYYKSDEKIAFDEKRAFDQPEVVESPTSPAMTVTEKGKRASITVQPVEEVVTAESLPAVVKHAHAAKPGPTKRIDYLAGLVAVACIGVTLHHWCKYHPWDVASTF
jgi:hypothetical protein